MQKIDKKTIKQIIRIIVALILFVAWTVFVKLGFTKTLDSFIINIVSKIPRQFSKFFYVITKMGGTKVLPVIAIVLVLLIAKFTKIGAIQLAISLATSASTNLLLKQIIKRQRPTNIGDIIEIGYSYPSGHSVNNFVFYSMLIIILKKYGIIKNNKIQKAISICLIAYMILVAFSRLYFNVHYISDIIGGALESTIIINLVQLFYIKKERREE